MPVTTGAAIASCIADTTAFALEAEKQASIARGYRKDTETGRNKAEDAKDAAVSAQNAAASAAASAASATTGADAGKYKNIAEAEWQKAVKASTDANTAYLAAAASAISTNTADSAALAAYNSAVTASQRVTPTPPDAAAAVSRANDAKTASATDASLAGAASIAAFGYHTAADAALAASVISKNAAAGSATTKAGASNVQAVVKATAAHDALLAAGVLKGTADTKKGETFTARDAAAAAATLANASITAGNTAGAVAARDAAVAAASTAQFAAADTHQAAYGADAQATIAENAATDAEAIAATAGDAAATATAADARSSAGAARNLSNDAAGFDREAAAAYAAAQKSAADATADAAANPADAAVDAAAKNKVDAAIAAKNDAPVETLASVAETEASLASQAADAAETAATEAEAKATEATDARNEAKAYAEKSAKAAVDGIAAVDGVSPDTPTSSAATVFSTALETSAGYAADAAQARARAENAAARAGESEITAIAQKDAAAAAATAAQKASDDAAALAAESQDAYARTNVRMAQLQASALANPGDPTIANALAEATASRDAALASVTQQNSRVADAQAAAAAASLSSGQAVTFALNASAAARTASTQANQAIEYQKGAADNSANVATAVVNKAEELANTEKGRTTADASELELTTMQGELSAIQAAIDAGVPGAGVRMDEAIKRYQKAIASHSRSAFVFSSRAAFRVNKSSGKVSATPLIARATVPIPDNVAGLNRPYIQVLKTGEGDELVADQTEIDKGRRFDMFILQSVNLVDAEKMDVVETFGNPHFFASGRFTKKLTLQGLVRSEPRMPVLSKSSNGAQVQTQTDGVNQVSDYVVFRNFYDEWLRATKLAEVGGYIRVFVDGDYYDGYVQNLTFQRASEQEALVPWVMSMVLFRHWNVDDVRAKAVLKKQLGDTLAKVKPALSDRQAEAEKTDALGKTELFVGVSGSDLTEKSKPAPVITLEAGSVKTVASKAEVRLALKATGTPVNLTVVTAEERFAKAVELRYNDPDTAVNGTPAPLQAPRELKLFVKDFSTLVTLMKAQATEDAGAKPSPLSITFNISSQSETVTVTFPVSATGNAQLTLDKVDAVSASTATAKTGAVQITEKGKKIAVDFPQNYYADLVPSTGLVRVKLKLKLKKPSPSDGSSVPLSLTSVEGVTMVAGASKAYAALNGLVASDPPDSQLSAKVSLTAIQYDALMSAESTISAEAQVQLALASGTITPGKNPFIYSNGIVTDLPLTITIPGYDKLETAVKISIKLPESSVGAGSIKGTFSSILPGETSKTETGFMVGFTLVLSDPKVTSINTMTVQSLKTVDFEIYVNALRVRVNGNGGNMVTSRLAPMSGSAVLSIPSGAPGGKLPLYAVVTLPLEQSSPDGRDQAKLAPTGSIMKIAAVNPGPFGAIPPYQRFPGAGD